MTSRTVGGLLAFVAVAGVAWFLLSHPDDVPVDVPLVEGPETTVVSSPATAVDEAAEELVSPKVADVEPEQTVTTEEKPDDRQLVAYGRVFNPRGDPAKWAVIEGIATRAVKTDRGGGTLRLDALADGDGRYEMRSPTAIVDVKLQARHEGFSVSSIVGPRDPGRECDLTLTEAASLSGVVLAGSDIELEHVTVNLEPDRDTRRRQLVWISSLSDGRLDGGGAYRFDGLAPGSYTVSVRSNQHFSWDALAKTPPLAVEVGAAVVAPMIDLGTAVNRIRVEVVDEFGAPIPKGTGSYWRDSIGDGTDIETVDGVAVLHTPYDAVVAWFGAPGRRTVEVPKLNGDTRVVLPPAYAVRARLANPSLIQHDPYVMWIEAWCDLGQQNWPLGQLTGVSPVSFDGGGEATFESTVARPLHFNVSISDSRQDKNGRPVRQRLQDKSIQITINDQTGEQVIDIDIDTAAVDAALEALGL